MNKNAKFFYWKTVKMLMFVLLLLLPLFTACGAEKDSVVIDGLAAYVNERVITIGEVVLAMQPLKKKIEAEYGGGEQLKLKLKEAYTNTLNALIEQELILKLFEKEKMNLPDWVVDERVNEVMQESFGGDRSALLKVLSEEKMSFEEWQKMIRDQIIVSSMRVEYVYKKVKVSPVAVREAYDNNSGNYRMTGKIRVRTITLKKPADKSDSGQVRAQAEEVRGKAAAGENFAELARKYSKDSKAADGGAWGLIEPKILGVELANAAAGLTPVEVSRVVETDEAFCIIKLEERVDERVVSFEEAQEKIEDKLKDEESRRVYDVWMKSLKEGAYIKVFDTELF